MYKKFICLQVKNRTNAGIVKITLFLPALLKAMSECILAKRINVISVN